MLKTSKQNHYRKFLEENKKNCKALWNEIYEIIYSKQKTKSNAHSSLLIDEKTSTNIKHIAEVIFSQELEKIFKIKYIQLKKIICNISNILIQILFLTQASPKEVTDIIQNLKTTTSTGQNSLPTKLLKQI